jgi:hypothetical protein
VGRGDRGRRAQPLVVLASVLALAVAGCAGIPTSGRVVEGDPVLEPQPQYVGLEPDPPRAGDDEAEIVDGFVTAMASYEPDYPTAREFLTPEASAEWRPSDGMTIYASSPSVDKTAGGVVRVTMAVLATVGPDGYVDAPAGTTEVLNLALRQVDDEWRISNPPAGIILSNLDFGGEFAEYNLYFFDPTFQRLVPDPVFMPVRGSRATLLAEALLRGPSRWLAPAVGTAFPPETGLGVPVRVESGRASVELTSQARTGTPEQVKLMGVQLARTLDQLEGIRELSVTSDGRPLMAGDEPTMSLDAYPEYDPSVAPRRSELYAIGGSGVVQVGDRGSAAVAGPLGATGLEDVAVNVESNQAAAVAAGGTQLIWAALRDEAVTTVLANGTDFGSLSWDSAGLVWAVDQTVGGPRVLVTEPGSESATVLTAGLDGRTIDDLAVSLDGARVAIASGGEVLVGIVVRDADRPGTLRIDALRPLLLDGGPVTAVTWAGPTTLATLVRAEGDVPEVYRVELARSIARLAGRVPGATWLAASPGRPLAVGTDDGKVLRQEDTTLQWVEIAEAVSPAYPG